MVLGMGILNFFSQLFLGLGLALLGHRQGGSHLRRGAVALWWAACVSSAAIASILKRNYLYILGLLVGFLRGKMYFSEQSGGQQRLAVL